jgi:hypothetical protein
MRNGVNLVLGAAVLTGIVTMAVPPSTALAAGHDGTWTVLVLTEKGSCDRGYRYDVRVSGGQLKYQGTAPVDLAGTVAASGSVKVSIRVGDQGASGSGRLSANTGAGTWHGIGANGSCAGRWEAERHGS